MGSQWLHVLLLHMTSSLSCSTTSNMRWILCIPLYLRCIRRWTWVVQLWLWMRHTEDVAEQLMALHNHKRARLQHCTKPLSGWVGYRTYHHDNLHGLGHVWSASSSCWTLHLNCGRPCFVVLLGCMLKFSLEFVCLSFSERVFPLLSKL
jgi:hypothetical protein